ncbi:MAG: 2-dehydropantoate 2-reductase [Desulfobacterales bacterium]|jgi:2-dehydropantoate 2-reductase
MKIAVVGAGAMGSLFGALLSEKGNDVWLYDVWKEHIQAVHNNGLHIERSDKTRRIDIKATTRSEDIGHVELAIIFVKSTHTESAAAIACGLAGAGGLVITLQNGMGNADVISKVIDPDRILAGTTSHGATMLGPGKVRHAGSGPTTIGMWEPSKKGFARAKKFADFFTQAGIETEAVENVRDIVWHKLFINVGINAITALAGIKNGQILDLEVTRELSRAAVEEAIHVARAEGIEIKAGTVLQVFEVAKMTAPNRSSMGQDVDHHRQTEISAINGFIVRRAKRLGLKAPVNQTLTALVETLQHHYK